MGRDRHEPPPGLSEEELRRWKQWRKFTWLEGDIVITRSDQEPGEDADGGRDQNRTTGRED